ncbi:MAG: hypothetical protein Q8N91_03170 [Candidatus Omnitrophota bacterium]|nr:hypothetical protein [Candidatus Omnitrophota bacterium]
MIDKKIESEVKAMKNFLELWGKFHAIYTETISKEIISREDEERFLDTLRMIKGRYEELKGALDFRYMPHARLTDPVTDVLALKGIGFMSEKNLKKLNEDWRDSCVFLNNILEQLKNARKRAEELNPIGVFFRKVVARCS